MNLNLFDLRFDLLVSGTLIVYLFVKCEIRSRPIFTYKNANLDNQ